jgi:hypothetical protein
MWTKPETYEDAVSELAQFVDRHHARALSWAGVDRPELDEQTVRDAINLVDQIAQLNLSWQETGDLPGDDRYDWSAHERLVTLHLTRHLESQA